MQWPFTKNTTRYALVGSRSKAFLAAKSQTPTGVTAATPLGWSDNPLSEPKSIHQVMANVVSPSGQVFISLPLDHFEILSLAINKVPREVIGKILPYHIAKVMDEPLSDFIYDWQIVKELKDSLQLNVFLFPAKMFQELRNTLGHYKLNPTTLEPDVFSASAYLESRSLLQADESTMIALLWPKSISIAIHDKGNLVLTRNVHLNKPKHEHTDHNLHESSPEDKQDHELNLEPVDEPSQPDSLFEPHPDDLLANFLVETKKDEGENVFEDQAMPVPDSQDFFDGPAEMPQSQQTEQSWPAYINKVSLELMRTRDYFNSVVKGNQIKTVFIGGGEDAWQPLSSELQSSLDLNIERLMDPDDVSFGDALFEAVTIGVLS